MSLFRLELVKGIEYSPDWVELVSTRVFFEEAQADAVVCAGSDDFSEVLSDANRQGEHCYLRIVHYPDNADRIGMPDYDNVWHALTHRYAPPGG